MISTSIFRSTSGLQTRAFHFDLVGFDPAERHPLASLPREPIRPTVDRAHHLAEPGASGEKLPPSHLPRPSPGRPRLPHLDAPPQRRRRQSTTRSSVPEDRFRPIVARLPAGFGAASPPQRDPRACGWRRFGHHFFRVDGDCPPCDRRDQPLSVRRHRAPSEESYRRHEIDSIVAHTVKAGIS